MFAAASIVAALTCGSVACRGTNVNLSRDKAENGRSTYGNPPVSVGGGPAGAPTEENPTENLHANGPPPAGSAAAELPGWSPYVRGEAMESNGGSGAGAVGSKGQGATLTNGRNQESKARHPISEESNLDGKKTFDDHH